MCPFVCMSMAGLLGFAMHSDGTGHDDLYLPFDQTKDEGPNPSVKDGERAHISEGTHTVGVGAGRGSFREEGREEGVDRAGDGQRLIHVLCVSPGVTPSKGRYANLYMNGKEVYKFATRKVSGSRRSHWGHKGTALCVMLPLRWAPLIGQLVVLTHLGMYASYGRRCPW